MAPKFLNALKSNHLPSLGLKGLMLPTINSRYDDGINNCYYCYNVMSFLKLFIPCVLFLRTVTCFHLLLATLTGNDNCNTAAFMPFLPHVYLVYQFIIYK